MRHRRIIVLLVLVAFAGMVPASVRAQAPDEPSPTPERITIFVIDLSGSMNESFAGSETKLDAAKLAFTTAFRNAVGRGGRIAIRTYGDQLPSQPDPAAREQNCTTDTRLAVPLSDLRSSVDGVNAQVEAFQGVGDTPVGLALQQAAADIPPDTEATVVLFSDGRDECHDADLDGDPAVGPSWGPNPCEVAAALKAAADEFRAGLSRIDTIGLAPDAAAEIELQCIAEAAGGSYTPINTPDDLGQLEQILVDLAAPRAAVRLPGTPIVGTPTQQGAPTIPRMSTDQKFAVYTDRLPVNEDRWYHIPDYGPGGGILTATAFDLPAVEGVDMKLTMGGAPESGDRGLDQTREDVGVPRAPSASVRCPLCYWQGDSDTHDTYFSIRIVSEQPVPGAFDVELQIEDVAFGGAATACIEPAECYYAGQVGLYDRQRALAEAEIDELIEAAAPGDLTAERDQIDAEIAELQAKLNDPDRATTTTVWWPVLLALLVAFAGAGLGISLVRRRPQLSGADEGGPSGPATGRLLDATDASTPPRTPGATRSASSPDLTPLTAVTPSENLAPAAPPPPAPPANEDGASTGPRAERAPTEQPRTPGPFDPDATELPREQQDAERAAPPPPPPPPPPEPVPETASAPPRAEPESAPPAPSSSFDVEATVVGPEPGPATPSDAAPSSPSPPPATPTPTPTAPAPAPTPEGWYPDPARQARLRWWDGQRWTEHVQP